MGLWALPREHRTALLSQAFQSAYEATYGEEVQHPFTSETYDATVLIALAAAKAGTTTDSTAIRDALRSVANPPGEVVGPGIAGHNQGPGAHCRRRGHQLRGRSGTVDFDENGDVVGYIEVWQVKDGEIISTGRFELP